MCAFLCQVRQKAQRSNQTRTERAASREQEVAKEAKAAERTAKFQQRYGYAPGSFPNLPDFRLPKVGRICESCPAMNVPKAWLVSTCADECTLFLNCFLPALPAAWEHGLGMPELDSGRPTRQARQAVPSETRSGCEGSQDEKGLSICLQIIPAVADAGLLLLNSCITDSNGRGRG